tara:strand:- start:4271 stop:4996 length:726 start_codon:yes stop_codon:yes gene_type:complete
VELSNVSDKYEIDVAKYIQSLAIDATRPKVSSKYSDILIKHKGQKVWLEVKMNHTDNLGNTRVFFDGKKWDASHEKTGALSPLKQFCVDTLNKSREAKKFLEDLEKFAKMEDIKIPTTLGGLKDPKAVPLDVMKNFFNTRNRYILKTARMDMGKLVTAHYIKGKAEPVYYMQAADDFYMISKKNPLGVPRDVPLLSGVGEFKMRVSTRSRFYEVQPEVKIMKMPSSKYSLKPGTRKKNPFE